MNKPNRHLWRLAHEVGAVPTRRYAHGAGLMDDSRRVEQAKRFYQPSP